MALSLVNINFKKNFKRKYYFFETLFKKNRIMIINQIKNHREKKIIIIRTMEKNFKKKRIKKMKKIHFVKL